MPTPRASKSAAPHTFADATTPRRTAGAPNRARTPSGPQHDDGARKELGITFLMDRRSSDPPLIDLSGLRYPTGQSPSRSPRRSSPERHQRRVRDSGAPYLLDEHHDGATSYDEDPVVRSTTRTTRAACGGTSVASCWMCNCVCHEVGWFEQPAVPTDAVITSSKRDDRRGSGKDAPPHEESLVSKKASYSSTKPYAYSRHNSSLQNHSKPAILAPSHVPEVESAEMCLTVSCFAPLTLCTRCSRALSRPPGTSMLDILHSCNATFAARNRSHGYVSFLREYKTFLEVITLELLAMFPRHQHQHQQHRQTALSPDAVGVDNSVRVYTSLLQCVEDSLSDDQRREQDRSRHDKELWLLKVSEKSVLLDERRRLSRQIALLTRKQTIKSIADTRNGHNDDVRDADGSPSDEVGMSFFQQGNHEASTTTRIPIGVGADTAPPDVFRTPRRLSTAVDEQPSLVSTQASGVASAQIQRRSASSGEPSFESWLEYFSDDRRDPSQLPATECAVMPRAAPVTMPQAHTHKKETSEGRDSTPSLRQVAQQPTNVVDLNNVEAELRRLREEHAKQRSLWVSERETLIEQLDVTQRRLNEATFALHQAERQHSRDLEAMRSHDADADATSVRHMRTLHTAMGEWWKHVFDLFSSLRTKKEQTLLLEVKALCASTTQLAASWGSQLAAARRKELETKEHLSVVTKARDALLLMQQRGGDVQSNQPTGTVMSVNDVTYF